MTARALAAMTKDWVARGPAPQCSHFFTNSGARLSPARGPGEPRGVFDDVVGDGQFPDDPLQLEDFGGVQHLLEFRLLLGRRYLRDGFLVFFAGIVDVDAEHESVELRFRQRIRPLLFERVLCCEDEKGEFQRIRYSRGRARCSCMASRRAACVFGASC